MFKYMGIEKIEGNGWDIDANHIELNGINAHIIHDPENRFITLDGPAVEDLFKSLHDLLKENSRLNCYINAMEKGDETANYCANDVLTMETLHLRQIIEEQDKGIKRLVKDLKEKDIAIRTLEKNIEEKNGRIKTLNREVEDRNSEIERLNSSLSNYYELYEKCSVLEKKVKNKDIEIGNLNDKLEKYDGTKEILKWLDGEIKNNTDYATKIFNKESRENIFSITFCKVPVEPEVVANEQG